MRDVHAMPPTQGRLPLRSVGVTGIRKPISVQRPDRVVQLAATFSVSVDLPASRKGSDLSRNAELLAEIVDQTVTRPVASLEGACAEIAGALLVRHPYANEASVSVEAEYFLRRGISDDRRSFEDYTVLANARATRGDGQVNTVRGIGGEAVGMTACPCAMETCRERLSDEFPGLRRPEFKNLPMITHNQRNRTSLRFDLPENLQVEVDEILEAVEAAQSAPTYAILKRGDEASLVLQAHRNPRFVEDVLRVLLVSLPRRFPLLPDETVAHARTTSEESIHKFNVEAHHDTTLGVLRANASAS